MRKLIRRWINNIFREIAQSILIAMSFSQGYWIKYKKKWYHIILTFNPSSDYRMMNIYINGKKVDPFSNAGRDVGGFILDALAGSQKTTIDEVFIHNNYGLKPEEAKKIYKRNKKN